MLKKKGRKKVPGTFQEPLAKLSVPEVFNSLGKGKRATC